MARVQTKSLLGSWVRKGLIYLKGGWYINQNELITQVVFLADDDYSLREGLFWIPVAATAGTIDVRKCTGFQAPAAGTSMLTSTVDLTAAVVNNVANFTDVYQPLHLAANEANVKIARGDRVAFVFAGFTAGSLLWVAWTLQLVPLRERMYKIVPNYGD